MSNVDPLTMKSILSSNVCSIFSLLACQVVNFIFIGCATSALEGSSPRGYSQIFSGIGSKVFAPCLVFLHQDLHKQFLKALLMGVSPEAMVGFLGGNHRLKIFLDLYSFDLADICDVIDMITFYNDLTGR
jgi:hypothetical protein